MATTVRMTITVPRELRTRMDAADEFVNWSAVASRAFEQTLADIVSRKGVKQMEDVVTRLRASKQKHASRQRQDGFVYGQKWASQHAEADELIRLEDGYEGWTTEVGFGASAYTAGELFEFMIRPDNDGSRAAAEDFWKDEAHSGDGWEPTHGGPDFVLGFAEGALQVWTEVKDKL